MKQVILFITNRSDLFVIEQIEKLLKQNIQGTDIVILFNMDDTLPDALQPYHSMIYPFSNEIIYQIGYKPLGDNLVYGNCHFPVLKFYLEHKEYDFYWIIEDDVTFNGDWSVLFDYYKEDDTDLLSTFISRITETPNWVWWRTLVTGKEVVLDSDKISSFNPIYRLSNRALYTIHESLLDGWGGHAEAVLATILVHHRLTIKDMGGTGSFTPKCDKNRFYTDSTHSFQSLSIQDWSPNTIYHPIKRKKRSGQLRQNCVISAVGSDSLHKNWLNGQKERSFDLHLIVYDNSFGKFYNDGDFVSAKRGYKLRLVYDYLKNNPELLDAYDYYFIPDDDIMTNAKDIEKLFKTMEKYNLQIAQPALRDSYYTYPITLRNSLCKLRYTSFVEMMLPCFSNNALKKVLNTFNANISGWGVEFHWPKLIETNGLDMAVLDNVPMMHTQPVKQGRQANVLEMKSYMKDNQLSPDIREIAYIPLHPKHWENIDFERTLSSFRNKTDELKKIADILLSKVYSKEIVRKGLDGVIGVALLCYEIGQYTENAKYNNACKKLINCYSNIELDFDSLTLRSFVEGDLGIIWAYRYICKKCHLSTKSIDKELSQIDDIVAFDTTLGFHWSNIDHISVGIIMSSLMKYVSSKRKSEDVQLIEKSWILVSEIEQSIKLS